MPAWWSAPMHLGTGSPGAMVQSAGGEAMMRRHTVKLFVAVSALALLTGPVWADDAASHGAHMPAGAQVGEVNFPTSCSPDTQRRFNQAVWTLHSFWYEEALKEFTAVTEAEPSCAMGYWGIAMSHWYPLWFPPTPAMLEAGAAAVAKCLAVPPATERERAYLEAIGRFFRDSDTLDHRTRALAYMQAMQALHERYPDDREAGVFYALALDATWPPTDKSYANLRKAAAILEPVWAEQPNHPGGGFEDGIDGLSFWLMRIIREVGHGTSVQALRG